MNRMILFTVDPEALGRVDHSTLSQLSLLELLLNDNKSTIGYKADKVTKDIEDWSGVGLYNDKSVNAINWSGPSLHGIRRRSTRAPNTKPIQLQWIPETVQNFCVTNMHIDEFSFRFFPQNTESIIVRLCSAVGTFESSIIPRKVKTVILDSNQLDGSLKAAALPPSLEILLVCRNKLSGEIQFADLPKSLRTFAVRHNNFSGSVHLKDLPPSIEFLDIAHNAFTGEILFPMYSGNSNQVIGAMRIHHNRFEGPIRYTGGHMEKLIADGLAFDFNNPPYVHCVCNKFTSIDWGSMQPVNHLEAQHNALQGTFDTDLVSENMKFLNVSHNQLAGSLDLSGFTKCFEYITEFSASDNSLTGSLNFLLLPPNLQRINLAHNHFHGKLEFGDRMPVALFLENNGLTSVALPLHIAANVRWLSIANNAILQEKIVLHGVTQDIQLIDFCGNSIDRIEDADGELIANNSILYAKGRDVEKKVILEKLRWTKIE